MQQRGLLDYHAPIYPLGHVIQRERCNGRRGQRLHFDACLTSNLTGDIDYHAREVMIDSKIDGHLRNGQGMAQGIKSLVFLAA